MTTPTPPAPPTTHDPQEWYWNNLKKAATDATRYVTYQNGGVFMSTEVFAQLCTAVLMMGELKMFDTRFPKVKK